MLCDFAEAIVSSIVVSRCKHISTFIKVSADMQVK
jgi:hypothetical protein